MSVSRNVTEARNQALRYALEIAENRGIEGLREEITRRGLMNISLLAPVKEILESKVKITERTCDIVMVLSMKLMIDEFGFDDYDAKLFYEKFNEITAAVILDPDKNLEKEKQELFEKIGFTVDIRKGLEEIRR